MIFRFPGSPEKAERPGAHDNGEDMCCCEGRLNGNRSVGRWFDRDLKK